MSNYDRRAGFPWGSSWDEGERRLLADLHLDASKYSETLTRELHKTLKELDRSARSDSKKKETVSNLYKLLGEIKASLDQLGYEAKRAYDINY